MSSLLRLALEEPSTGIAVHEKEYVFYAKITDFSFLEKAASNELHDQWEIKIPKSESNAGQGRIRVRCTCWPGLRQKAEYVLTTKTKLADGENEVAIPTSEDNFRQFQIMSYRGMLKRRYIYPIVGSSMKWEVDLYFKPGTTFEEACKNDTTAYFADWCKIDLEVTGPLETLPPFPFESQHIIDNNTGNANAADKQIIHDLYDTLFITKNRFLQA